MRARLRDRLRARGDDLAALDLISVTRLQLYRWWSHDAELADDRAAQLDRERKARLDQTIRHRCLMEEQARLHGDEVRDLRERAVADAAEIDRLRRQLTEAQAEAATYRSTAIVPQWDRYQRWFGVARQLPDAIAQLPAAVGAAVDQQSAGFRDQVRTTGLDPDDPSHVYALLVGLDLAIGWAAHSGVYCSEVDAVGQNVARLLTSLLPDQVVGVNRG